DPDDMRMAHRRDQLVLEQEALEQAPAGLARPILDDLADDPLAGLLVLGEIDGREVRRIELRDEAVAPRAEPSADPRRNALAALDPGPGGARRRSRARTLAQPRRRRAVLDRVPQCDD